MLVKSNCTFYTNLTRLASTSKQENKSMNALSINIPANFAAGCNNTLKRYDAERRAVLDR